ncbi:ras-domain-containing protein [Peniophora sp. CONT]|nr:ras-domain-containing protein [Peniophora sp. CONT]
MAAYPRLDPYKSSRYDQGIDAKIVVMGNTGVGKTSLLQRYTQNKFDPKNTTSTTGAFFVTKKVVVDGVKVRLQLWDTAGQERFRSMAPMYYRGANAALLLYDLTSKPSFDAVRGWLEELKKNCAPDLLIYIVGAKADLVQFRQVSHDLARLSLSQWFPPPRPPTPPPPPQPSTFSYIRPRFTSFTSIRSAPLSPHPRPSPPESHSSYENTIGSPPNQSHAPGLKRSNTAQLPAASRSTGALLGRAKSVGAAGRLGGGKGYAELAEEAVEYDSRSEDDTGGEDGPEWGLSKDMELFEVSAKDNTGVLTLFDTLIRAIIARKDDIDAANEMKRRDSVFLAPIEPPTWAAAAEEEEAREKAATTAAKGWGNGGCCT